MDKFYKRLNIFILILLIASLITVTASGYTIIKGALNFNSEISDNNLQNIKAPILYICEYEGKIGIFNSYVNSAPAYTLEREIISFSPLDQDLFKKGLWVTESQLNMIIEDLN